MAAQKGCFFSGEAACRKNADQATIHAIEQLFPGVRAAGAVTAALQPGQTGFGDEALAVSPGRRLLQGLC